LKVLFHAAAVADAFWEKCRLETFHWAVVLQKMVSIYLNYSESQDIRDTRRDLSEDLESLSDSFWDIFELKVEWRL